MKSLKAHIELDLGETLDPEELRQLLSMATAQKKPLERLLYEAAKDLVAKVTATRPIPADAAA